MVAGDEKRELLRHALATLAYRGGKAITGVPDGFSSFRVNDSTIRTPGQILAHIGDLLDWALSIAQSRRTWIDSPAQAWEKDVERFFKAIGAFDNYLASDKELGSSAEKLFQGPIADALTHVGQISILRRWRARPYEEKTTSLLRLK